jgi:hypothetical protein
MGMNGMMTTRFRSNCFKKSAATMTVAAIHFRHDDRHWERMGRTIVEARDSAGNFMVVDFYFCGG